jgi:hypothetical protein
VTGVGDDGLVRGTYWMGDPKFGPGFEFSFRLAVRAKGDSLSADLVSIARKRD